VVRTAIDCAKIVEEAGTLVVVIDPCQQQTGLGSVGIWGNRLTSDRVTGSATSRMTASCLLPRILHKLRCQLITLCTASARFPVQRAQRVNTQGHAALGFYFTISRACLQEDLG
jgi:hypothetical protein